MIATVRDVQTVCVRILKPCRSVPAGIVSEGGTVASLLPADRPSTRPPDGAFPVSTTVPIDALPPETDPGLSNKLLSTGANTVTTALATLPPPLMGRTEPSAACPAVPAATITGVSDGTGAVLIVNVADDPPGATVTEAGTDAAVELAVSFIEKPPLAGAMPSRLAVPVALSPPMSFDGVIVRVRTDAGSTVNVALATLPTDSACRVTSVRTFTPSVRTGNVALTLPSGIFNCEVPIAAMAPPNRATSEFKLLRVISIPPAGAAVLSVMVAVV